MCNMRLFLLTLVFFTASSTLLGGIGELFPANEEIQEIMNKIRPELENKANRKFEVFEAVEFRSQIVTGINYFVKVKVAKTEYIFVRAYVHFSGTPVELSAFQLNKAMHDQLNYFETNEIETNTMKSVHVPGNTGNISPATPDIQLIADSVRPDFEEKIGKKTSDFVAIHFITQTVAGTNYFIKVRVEADKYAFLRVHKPLSGKIKLVAHEDGKTEQDVIAYFEDTSMPLLGSGAMPSTPRVGAAGETRPATEDVQRLVESVREEFETKEGKQEMFKAINYKTQVVAGVNYFVKIQVSADQYAFLRIYRHFSGNSQLSSYQVDKSSSDEVQYFH